MKRAAKLLCLFILCISIFNLSNAQTTISSISPSSGQSGTLITINGTNFNTTAANNIVYFGVVRSAVPSAATSTSLTVTVPVGAAYGPITVLNTATGLQAQSKTYFSPNHGGGKSTIVETDFVKTNVSSGTPNIWSMPSERADLDLDGDIDLIMNNYNSISAGLLVFPNTSTVGNISVGPSIDHSVIAPVRGLVTADLDGDGKQDIIGVGDYNSVSVWRNTSTSNISFASRVDISMANSGNDVAVGDIDGDGKLDLAVTHNWAAKISVFLNTSTNGTISFAPSIELTAPTSVWGVKIGDINSDGKNDVVTTNVNGTACFSIYRNTGTTTGAVSFATRADFTNGTIGGKWIELGDIDMDGVLDLVVSNNDWIVSVFRNTSSGNTLSFATPVSSNYGWVVDRINIGDLNGDGKPDIIIPRGGMVAILRNTSTSGSVSLTGQFDMGASSGGGMQSIEVVDLDLDGKLDMFNGSDNTKIDFYKYSPPSSNANLSALVTSSGSLSPAFASGTTTYTINVTNVVSSITVTPTKENANASIQVRINSGTYATVSSGNASSALSLNLGSNTIDIRVAAQDGSTFKTYTITVTRAAGPTTYYVKPAASGNGTGTSWSNASSDLQAIINNASSGDEIWVSAGNFMPTRDVTGNASPSNARSKTFLLKEGIKLYGGFNGTETLLSQRNINNNVSVLSGDLGVESVNTDNAYHVLVASNLTTATIFSGFKVTNGNGNAGGTITVNGNPVDNGKGGGIHCANSTMTFDNIKFENNYCDASYGGGAVYGSRSGTLTFNNCLFSNNGSLNASGGFGWGGAYASFDPSPYSTNAVFSKCIFISNSGVTGGAIFMRRGVATVSNSVFAGNSATNGGAIYIYRENNESRGAITNCTFYNNSGSTQGKSFWGASNSTVQNCIFYNNSGAAPFDVFGDGQGVNASASVAYCLLPSSNVSSNTITSNNVSGDPKFVNINNLIGDDGIWSTADDGLMIGAGSVAFNVGNNGNSEATDIIGTSRPQFTTVDVGAYESTLNLAATTNANLSALTTTAGTLTPTFVSSTTTYTASVINGTTSVTVTPTKEDANATIEVRVNNGSYSTVTSGNASSSLNLNVGNNTIDIKVTAQDGTTIKTYTVTVTRAGNVGNALHFDGVNDRVLITDNTNLRLSSGSFTIEYWAKPTAINGNFKWVISKDNGNGSLDYLTGLNSTNNWRFIARNLNVDITGTTLATINTWYHVACVFNGTSATLYVNGVLEGTDNTIGSAVSNTANVIVGARNSGAPGEFFPGTIDDIRIWNTARTLSQITANMNSELVGNESGLVSYFNCNHGVAGGTNTAITTLVDATSNKNNGTLYNFDLTGTTSNWVNGYVSATISTNANLSSLTTTAGTLTPTFVSSTTTYTASVINGTTSVTVTPTKEDANATIEVRVNNGSYSTVTSGNASSSLNLNVGNNTIDIKVTAQDGTTIKTYTVTVTRASVPITIPTINSFTPIKGNVGTSVTITGTGFNTTAANNIVFFGATKAVVTGTPTPTSITVNVPSGATHSAITILNTETRLSAMSAAYFTPTFNAIKPGFSASDFSTTASFSTNDNPVSVAIGDLDGDGKSDVVVSNQVGNVSVFLNTSTSGNISFATKADLASGGNAYHVNLGDIDGDGKLDMAVANYGSNTVSIFRNTTTSVGSITFAPKVDLTGINGALDALIGDVDGDGKVDITAISNSNNQIVTFLNTGTTPGTISFNSGTTFTTGSNPYGGSIGDIDGDGKLDIVVSNAASSVSIFRNTSVSGSVSFASRVDVSAFGNVGTALGDVDGDGKLDISTCFINLQLIRNTSNSGNVNVANAVVYNGNSGYVPAFGDLDGDGKVDALTSYISAWQNTSNGGNLSFGNIVSLTALNGPYGVAVGDIDGDGKPEIIGVNNFGNTMTVLRNNPEATTWVGSVSSDWNNSNNWSPASVPTSSTYVIIPSSTSFSPTVSDVRSVNGISINNGATITINNTLNISGALINDGIIAGTGSVVLNGTSNQTISGLGTIQNLTINNNNGVTITGGSTTITGTVTPQLGTLTTNGNLVLASTATNTARIASGTGSYINGNITVQRFIPAKSTRRFSFITSPVGQSLSGAWQQQIHITGAGTGGTVCPTLTAHSNGFDATVLNNPSMFTYNASLATGSRWQANSTGTTTLNLVPGDGYRLLVRGARNIGCSLLNGSIVAPTSVTLSATGPITSGVNMGTVTKTYNNNVANNWVLIGNPYPSELNFTDFRTTNSTAIGASYIIYDPQNTPDAAVAANMYSTWNAGTWSNAPTSISNANGQYVANGQAFFVQATDATNLALTFNESHKYNGSQNGVFRIQNWNDIVRIGLNKEHIKIDQTVIRFTNNNSVKNETLGLYDATLFSSSTAFLASRKAGKDVSIQTRKYNQNIDDEVLLNFDVATSGNYTLNFSEFEKSSIENMYLVDEYTHTKQNIKQNTIYSFEVDKNNPQSFGENRFKLTFKRSSNFILSISRIKLFPNPTSNSLTLELPNSQANEVYTIKIVDMKGRVQVVKTIPSGVQQLGLGNIAAGKYVVEIVDGKGNKSIEHLIKN